MAKTTVLIAEPIDEHFERLKEMVSKFGLKVVRAKRTAEVFALVKAGVDMLIVNPNEGDLGQDAFFEHMNASNGVGWLVESDAPNVELLMSCLRAGCSDWITRPSTDETLREGFERMEKRHNRKIVTKTDVADSPRSRALVKEIARRIREGNIDLPEVPQVITELNQALTDLEVESAKVVEIVERDPSLSARVVSTANAAQYGGQNWNQRITDLGGAVTRMGNLAVRNLVQAEAIKDMFQFRSPAFKAIFDKMWQSHFLVAKVAREISLQRGKDDADEMYLSGLLHNIGELFLLRVFGEFFQKNNNQILSMDEVLGMVREWHTVFGAGLLKKWELGQDLEFLAKLHHTPSAYTDETTTARQREMLYTVALANQLAEYAGRPYYTKSLYLPGIQDCYDALEMEAEAKDTLRERVQELIR